MNQVTLPGTDLVVSRLSFGTASLHHVPTSAKRQQLLETAVACGFTHFDTSPLYGFGIGEHELGVLHRRGAAGWTVATKVGLYPPGGRTASTLAAWGRKVGGKIFPALSRAVVDWSVKAAESSLSASLRALGRERIDVLFLHEPIPGILHTDEFVAWMTRQKQAEKIRYWGLAGRISKFSAWASHPIGRILQVHTSDLPTLKAHGREPQLTFGALSSARHMRSASDIVTAALEANTRGSLIVSTRRSMRVRFLAQAVPCQR